MSQSDYLILDGLSKRFDGGAGVRDVSLSLARGEILALLGPSGSGKTTTLRLLAGFEQPDAGRIVVNGADVTTMAPVARRFGMVFQHYALFPHLTVAQNVAFGLESLKLGTAALTDRVEGCSVPSISPVTGPVRLPRCRAVSSSGSRSRGRLLQSRRYCCWMNPCRISTPRFANALAASCGS